MEVMELKPKPKFYKMANNTTTKHLEVTMSNHEKNCLDWLIDKLIEHRYIKVNQTTYEGKYKHETLLEQAKEMYQDELEAVVIKQCAEESTQNASAYAIGYSSGYKRALDLVKWKIDNELNQKNEQQ